MAKGCIFLATTKMNFQRRDIISCGINFYYSMFHVCVAILAVTPNGAFLEKGIIDWKDRFSAPKYYLPCSHGRLIKEIRKINSELANFLEELRELREYICYGPYFCSENIPAWQPRIYTCEIENVKQKLESFYFHFPFNEISELLCDYLKEGIQKTVFCIWVDQIMKIFKESIEINDVTYEESNGIWSIIRKRLCPQLERLS